ncbi:hypothetical protein D3C87_1270010 [compost metagenome]
MHGGAVHDERVDAQATVEAREVAAVDADRVVARATVHRVARAHLREGVVAGTAFEAVGEAESGDERVVAVGVDLRGVVEHMDLGLGTDVERAGACVLQRDRHALLHEQFGVEARVLVHLIDHAIHRDVGLLDPVARVGAVGQHVGQRHLVAGIALDHHLHAAVGHELVDGAVVHHVGQRQLERVVARAGEVDDFNRADFARERSQVQRLVGAGQLQGVEPFVA